MGADFNNRAAVEWGPLQTPISQQVAQTAVNSVDIKQKTLVKAIANIVQAAAADLYGNNSDKKYRYIVDLILDRIHGALSAHLETLSESQIEAISSQNEQLFKSLAESTAEIVEQAFEKLDVNLNEKQLEGLLEQFQEKLDDVSDSIVSQIKGIAVETKKKTAAQQDSGKQTLKSVEELKKKLAQQFSQDQIKKPTAYQKSEKAAFKAATVTTISKNLASLAKNQKLIAQSMTKRFEKTTKTISGRVGKLHQTTSTNFYNLNDKLENAMSKFERQVRRISVGIIAGVVGAISLTIAGIKKTFGAVFNGLKSISNSLFKLFKKPAGVIGDLLKNLIMTPGGMFAIGWIAGYVWKKWLKPLWDWMKPIRDAIGEWFGGKLTFKEMISKIWSHIVGGIKTVIEGVKKWFRDNWDTIKETVSKVWNWISKTASDFWKWLSPHLETFWKWLEPKLKKAWDFISPIITKALGKIWDWFLDKEFCNVFGVSITGRRIMYMLAAYLLTKAITKIVRAVKVVTKIVKGIGKGFGFIKKAVKGIWGAVKLVKDGIAKLLKGLLNIVMPSRRKPGKGKSGKGKPGKKPGKKPNPKNKGKGKNTSKAKSQRAKAQPRDAKGRFTKKPQVKTPTGPKPASAMQKTMRTTGKIAKGAAKAAGTALVAVDVGMDLWDAKNAIAAGEYGEAASKAGFATAKAATLAAGPFAPVAYGAIMGAEYLKGKIDECAQEWDTAVDEMNQRTAESMTKLKEMSAKKKLDNVNKTMLDRMVERYQNFDKAKAEFDPLKKQRDEINKQIDQARSGLFGFTRGSKVRELQAQYDKLDQQLREISIKSGIGFGELERTKDDLFNSRNSKLMFNQLSEEEQERFKQIMAEQTKIGPDNLKILPDTQKVLEQLQAEFGGQTAQVESKVDGVAETNQQILAELQAQREILIKNGQTMPPMVINQSQYQVAQERPMTILEK